MSTKQIAIVGLGNVGTELMRKLMEHEELGLQIKCVSELHDTIGKKEAEEQGIPVVSLDEITAKGDTIDIIFDLTGATEVRRQLRDGLFRSENKFTVIVSENVSHIIWSLLTGNRVPDTGHSSGY